MKILYLLRHAKSSWGDRDLDDHDRPLNDRGRKAAGLMGRFLRDVQAPPRLVLASTARRVSETLALMLPELTGDITLIRDRSLYLASPDQLLSRLREVSTNPASLLILAHNPGIHELALKLSGEVEGEAGLELRDRLKAGFPTAALAVIRFPTANSWRAVGYGQGRLEDFVTPKTVAAQQDD